MATLDWKHWALSHAVWIVAVAVALIMGRSLLAEHDARLLVDAQVKTLQQHIATTDALAAQKVTTIVKIVHDAKTPAQQIAAVPQLSDIQLNARPIPSLTPDAPPQVAVDLAPLVQELGQCRKDSVQLTACQSDLKDSQAVIVDLKKKPSFWKRITSHGKTAAVAIVIFEIAKIALTKQI